MVETKNSIVRFLNPLFIFAFYAFLYLPIVILVLFSFNNSSMATQWSGFTLQWYKKLCVTPEIMRAVWTSVVVAVSATFLSVGMGTALVFASRWWRPRFLFKIFYITIALPEIIMALGLLSFFTFFKIPLGYASLIVGHTLLGLGFVIPIVRARFVELDPILTEASADLGATPLQTFKKVIIPLLLPSILASSLLVFTLSLDDFFIAFFCSGTGVETLSLYVYLRVREGIDPSINALAACLLAMSSLCIVVLCFFKVLDQVIAHE